MSDNIDREAQKARDEELRRVMEDDLGVARREENLTADYRAQRRVNLDEIYAERDSEKRGTVAHERAQRNQLQLQGWTSLAVEPEEAHGADIAAGQTHREALSKAAKAASQPQSQSSRVIHGTNGTQGHTNHSPLGHRRELRNNLPHPNLPTPENTPSPPPPVDIRRDGFPLDPAVDQDRPSYSLRSSARRNRNRNTNPRAALSVTVPAHATRPARRQSYFTQRDELQRRNRDIGISPRGIQSQFNRVLNQPSPSIPFSSRQPSSGPNTNDHATTTRNQKPKLTVATMQGWDPDKLATNETSTSTIVSFDTQSNRDSKVSALLRENPKQEGTKSIETSVSIEVKDEASMGRMSPIKEAAEEPSYRLPKRQKIDQPSPSFSARDYAPTSIDHTETAVKVDAMRSSGENNVIDDVPADIKSTTHTDAASTTVDHVDTPKIQFDPRDPLSTAVRAQALSSAEEFWKWKGTAFHGSNSVPSVVPQLPPVTAVPGIMASRYADSNSHLAATSTTPASVSTAATILPSGTITQWTSPTLNQLQNNARTTNTAVTTTRGAFSIPSSRISNSHQGSSASNEGATEMSHLTRRFDSWSLSSRRRYQAQDSEDEDEDQAEANSIDRDTQDISENRGGEQDTIIGQLTTGEDNAAREMLVIGNVPIPARDVWNFLGAMTEQELENLRKASKGAK